MYKSISLDKLRIGENGKVMSIDIDDKKLKRYIIDMGITMGTIVRIKKVSPFRDVLDIEVRDYELCLRKNDLKNILVEVLD